MRRFFTWKDLINLWKLEDFQLFNLQKKGLQPYTQYGKKISDAGCLERALTDSLETIKKKLHAKEHARVLGSGSGSERPPMSEWEIKQTACRIYKSQKLKIVNPPKDCAIISLSIPIDEIKARKKLMQAQGWLFEGDNVLEVARKHGLPLPSEKVTGPEIGGDKTTDRRPVEQEKANEPPYEYFIRNLRVSYESDLEIKIQEPGKKAKTPDYESLEFDSEITKEWKTLLQILQNPGLTYNVGKAHIYSRDGTKNIRTRNKSYDAELNTLKRINTKLIDFLNKQYQLRIPKDFKLYERCLSDKPGTYRLKFQTGDVESVDLSRNIENYYKGVNSLASKDH